MTDAMTVGERVAFYRKRRGLSQEVLAGLAGKTAEWLRKVENNRAELDRLSVIRTLALALDVTIADLIGEPGLFEWTDESGKQTIPALRAALRDYRHLSPVIASDTDEQPPNLAEIEREVSELWTTYQQSRYGVLARRLPQLIHDCLTASRLLDADHRRRANEMTAYAHHVATLFLTKLGETDLAWIAARRGLAAANATEDYIVIGALSRATTHALTANGEFTQAREVASAAATFLESHLRQPTPRLLSVYGSLHLMSAVAAARDNDRPGATAHLGRAADSATQLGADANHVWTAFGPTNVTIHQTCVAVELGDIQRAIAIGPPLDTRALPVERQVRHCIEVARAYSRWNRADDATAVLLTAERVAPDQVRYHNLSRTVVRDLISRPRPNKAAIDLSIRMGVRSPTPPW